MNILIANPALRFELEGKDERYFFGAGCRFPWSLRKDKSAYPRFAMFPFFLGYTAGLLERDGFEVKAIDAVPLNLSHDEFIRRAVAVKPEVILFEPATPAINWVGKISAELAEQTGARIVFAGSHVTSFPREILERFPHVDFVLVGEYEMTFLELARALKRGGGWENLRGLAYRNEAGEFQGGERSEEIDPVDQLPAPARHLFPAYFNTDLGRYHDGFCQHRPTIQLHSSRGCPFRCNFCLWIQVMYNNGKHRSFAPSRTVDEMIEAVTKFGAKEIYFDDDDFTVRKQHVLELCDEMERRGVRIPWSVMGDAMATDEETLERMARAGCIGMKFGLESADPVVLKRIGKPIKLDRVHLVANTARRLGIKTHMTVTFGLSGETHESIQRTFDFACGLDVDSVQFSVATPYPGTRFYDELQKAGRLKFKTWEDLDGANNAVFDGEGLDPAFVEEFEATAHGRWLRHKLKDPRWVLRQARYLGRLCKGQGLAGLRLRLSRGYKLLVQRSSPRKSLPVVPLVPGVRQRLTGPRP
ncbi:MAG TPA: radical SAM protein [Candidatus Acidoferrales bacterium]|nr:radical SAM protein [Candidatus Acidoferrales bacterium]